MQQVRSREYTIKGALGHKRRHGHKSTNVSARKRKKAKRKQIIAEMRAAAVKQPPNPETIERRRRNAQLRIFKRRLAKIAHWAERNGYDAKKAIGKLFSDLGVHLSKSAASLREMAMMLFTWSNVDTVPIAKYQTAY